MAAPRFVPLRVFSNYSLLESTIDLRDIASRARRHGFDAVALADRNGLHGAPAFSRACEEAKVQPIIGTLLGIACPDATGEKNADVDWLALYAEDETGYRNLCSLVSRAHLERPAGSIPHIALDDLDDHSEGIVALTAGREGALVRLLSRGVSAEAEAYADRLQALFPGRLYIELVRQGHADEERCEAPLRQLAAARKLPVVATNPCNFLDASGHEAQDILLHASRSWPGVRQGALRSSPEAWVKGADAMARLFTDIPEAIASTVEIAQRCQGKAARRAPLVPRPNGETDADTMLSDLAAAGLDTRLAKKDIAGREAESYRARLEKELAIIAAKQAAGYFLTVADFVRWARDNNIPTGPGRGGSAGSLVAWALGITALDPLDHGLMFERFLNPERLMAPDFDVDFCETRRDEVVGYVQDHYGPDRVAAVATFGKLKARAVLKEAGRMLDLPRADVERLARLIPNHAFDPWTLERALNGVAEVAEAYRDRKFKRLFDIALELEPLPRVRSTHAAAVVIGDRPLTELLPLCSDPRSDLPVTQFDMHYVEGAGPPIFDMLGFQTLSIQQKAVDLAAEGGASIDLDTLPLDDPAVFELLRRGDTIGIFQLETRGVRRVLKTLKPDRFEDIVLLMAMYRPGSMEQLPSLIARRDGEETTEVPHPLLQPILAETCGLFVYQEQIIRAAETLAGFIPGDADLFRRALGKKIRGEVDAERARFVEGCARTNDIPQAQAAKLFDLIERRTGYCFLKAHAASYALVAYRSAWLKAHHKPEFYAATMFFETSRSRKLSAFQHEADAWESEFDLTAAQLLLGDQPEFGSAEELSVRDKLLQLKAAVEEALAENAASHGRIGHNQPPEGEEAEAHVLPEAVDAKILPPIEAIGRELAAPEPDALVIARKASQLRTSLQWLGTHGGLASKEFAKAFGKTSGDEAAKALFRLPKYGAIIYALHQFLSHIDQWLRLIIH